MDFNWAMQQMRCGNKVRRKHWCKSYFIQMNWNGDVYEMNDKLKLFKLKFQSTLGTDWELYNPKFCLSDKIKLQEVSDIRSISHEVRYILYQDDVKQFIKLLAEKLNEELFSDKTFKDLDKVINNLAGSKLGYYY